MTTNNLYKIFDLGGSNKIINVKSEDVKSEDVKSEDVKSEDVKNEDVKSEDVKNEDVKSEDVNSEDIKSEDIKSEDVNSEDVKSEDVKSEDVKSEDVNSEDVKSEDVKSEDVNSENVKSEDVKSEDVNSENVNSEDVREEFKIREDEKKKYISKEEQMAREAILGYKLKLNDNKSMVINRKLSEFDTKGFEHSIFTQGEQRHISDFIDNNALFETNKSNKDKIYIAPHEINKTITHFNLPYKSLNKVLRETNGFIIGGAVLMSFNSSYYEEYNGKLNIWINGNDEKYKKIFSNCGYKLIDENDDTIKIYSDCERLSKVIVKVDEYKNKKNKIRLILTNVSKDEVINACDTTLSSICWDGTKYYGRELELATAQMGYFINLPITLKEKAHVLKYAESGYMIKEISRCKCGRLNQLKFKDKLNKEHQCCNLCFIMNKHNIKENIVVKDINTTLFENGESYGNKLLTIM
jgi:hypothetical protein